ncbi:unnamed protein product [Staurois parvus]|uniref:Uncharacterized protein n=1 Tax=Staurois parvus TaxID=386267 RepID=A0ABN9GN38_9NEOB|nr:unnamed protein product [Staurois parvus]
MGPPGNRGSWGPPVSLPKLKKKKAFEKVPGHLMGPPTDPKPSCQCPSFKMVSPPLQLICFSIPPKL